jgi:hypothetical protein
VQSELVDLLVQMLTALKPTTYTQRCNTCITLRRFVALQSDAEGRTMRRGSIVVVVVVVDNRMDDQAGVGH